jgi:hypothetical protein
MAIIKLTTMGNKHHLAPTPHTSNVHEYIRKKQSHEPNSKATNVLILGPFTARVHSKCVKNQENGQSKLKRVHSAPCLGSNEQSAHGIDCNTPLISESSSRLRLKNHAIIICTLILLFAVLMYWWARSSYKNTIMLMCWLARSLSNSTIIIALLISLVEKKFISLLITSYYYLPGGDARALDPEPQQETLNETMRCKLCYNMLMALNDY